MCHSLCTCRILLCHLVIAYQLFVACDTTPSKWHIFSLFLFTAGDPEPREQHCAKCNSCSLASLLDDSRDLICVRVLLPGRLKNTQRKTSPHANTHKPAYHAQTHHDSPWHHRRVIPHWPLRRLPSRRCRFATTLSNWASWFTFSISTSRCEMDWSDEWHSDLCPTTTFRSKTHKMISL